MNINKIQKTIYIPKEVLKNIDDYKIDKIVSYGRYSVVEDILSYLRDDLSISATRIEKCPSILYRNVNNIRENFNFIRNCNIHFSNIESCLHVLSSEPFELKMTYEYVKENYGLDIINRIKEYNINLDNVDLNNRRRLVRLLNKLDNNKIRF